MNAVVGRTAKRVLLEGLGWLLVVGGVVAMPLPGPGLLILLAGILLLAQQYEWAERRVEAVRLRALREAARSVSGLLPMAITLAGITVLSAAGVLWILSPPAPSWWSLPGAWWLPGGVLTGSLQIASALFALGMMVYSYRRFHGHPEALAELQSDRRENQQERAEEQPDLR